MQEQLYTIGFNHGYILSKYLPDLFTLVKKSVNSLGDYFLGFAEGSKEYQMEKEIIELNKLDEARSNSHDRNRDFEQER